MDDHPAADSASRLERDPVRTTPKAAEPRPGLPMQRPPVAAGAPTRPWPRLSVIIPTLNEARNVGPLLEELPDGLFEVIIVDGHSTDGTVEAALAVRPDCRVVTQTGRGKGDALTAGFTAARGDILITLDADGSADPAEIPLFVGALLAGADFTKGSRHLVGGGSADLTRVRSAGNRGLSILVNILFRTQFTDLCYGYNAFWRDCLPELSLDSPGFEIETLMNVRSVKAGLRVSEVPSFERPRRYGTSNLRAASDGWRVLRTILRERLSGRPPASERPRVARQAAPSADAPGERVEHGAG